MTNEELSFRATKDIDLVLIVEALNADFGRKFWEYVKHGRIRTFAARVLECLSSTGSVIPLSDQYPAMIELFSRKTGGHPASRRCHIDSVATG